MGSPYRSAPTTDAAQAPRDRGIVGDIIDQFADRFAFFRELVQNAIDAETAAIHVELTYDQAESLMRVRVVDRGDGMNRDIIENRLLVLFRSTKEQDDTKIGKFGIGFASVLSMRPNVIRVDSVHDGRRHVLHLYPDLSYELFDAGGAQTSGTTVELELGLAPEAVDGFVTSSWEALARWCRHATVPITLVASDATGAQIVDERIDRPMQIPDPVFFVRATSSDGGTEVVVGVSRGAKPYAGFFNYGLTLFESAEPLLGRLAFKIQDARLGHTLSRDNVRRDDHFERTLRFARHVAENRLPKAAATTLREAAGSGDRSLYRDVFEGVVESRIALPREQWMFPLIEPVGDRRFVDATSLARAGCWAATRRSSLTEGLARGAVPIVDLAAGGGRDFAAHVWSICRKALRTVDSNLLLVSPVEASGSDLVFLERLECLLDEAYRRPRGIALAEITGAFADRLSVAGGPDKALFASSGKDATEPWVLDVAQATRNPFGFLGRAMLVLNTGSPPIEAARRRAAHSPDTAARLVTRLLLLHLDRLDDDCSESLVERGLRDALEGLS